MDIKVRVAASDREVARIADELISAIEKSGYTLTSASEIYPCLLQRKSEGRIYLTFKAPNRKQ